MHRKGTRQITWSIVLALAWGAGQMVTVRADGIFVMKPDGSAMRKVIEVDGCKAHRAPQWSHDGKRLAFEATPTEGGGSKWYIVNVDGTGVKEMGESRMPHWSPDDKQLVFEEGGNGQQLPGIWVQNVDGQGRNKIADGFSPRWSPDGGRIAYSDETHVKVLDLVEGTETVIPTEGYEEILRGFEWSPDGKRLAFVGVRENVYELVIADLKGDSRVRVKRPHFEGHTPWSPDGKQMAVLILDSIWLLEPDGEKPPKRIPGQIGRANGPAWSHDGEWLAFGTNRRWREKAVGAVEKKTWKLQEVARHPKGSIVHGAAFTPDGRRVVMGGDPVAEGVQVWTPATGETKSLGGSGIAIAMFPDGEHFATSWLSSTIQIVSLDTGDVVRDFDHGATVRTIALSKDGRRLLSGGLDHLVHVWDMAAGERVCTFSGHADLTTRAVFSVDGQTVFSASADADAQKRLRVWNAATGEEIKRPMRHPRTIWGMAVSPHGRRLVTGTGGNLLGSPIMLVIDPADDNALRVWNIADGTLVHELKGHTNTVYSIDISPNGRLAVSGGWDGTTRLWDLEEGRELSATEPAQGAVMRVVFSPDGKQVLAGGGVSRTAGRIVNFPDEQVRVYQVVETPAAGR